MDQELQKERYELVTGRIREIAKEESVPARYQEYFQKTALFLEKVDETLQKKQQGLPCCAKFYSFVYADSTVSARARTLSIRLCGSSTCTRPPYCISQLTMPSLTAAEMVVSK